MIKKSCLLCTIIIFLVCFNSCDKHNAPDISKIHVDLKFLRFEQDLFNTDFEKISDSIPFFRKKYGEFFDVFNYKIINIGDYKNPGYPDLLKAFLTDYNTNQIIKEENKYFKNVDTLKINLTNAFRYYKYYFPNLRIPIIITYISGFNHSIVTTDTIIGIGLDKYLGTENNFYYQLGLAHYQRYNMHKGKIPADCIRAWALTQFPMSDSANNLIANMIYLGKVMYFTKALLPNNPDTIIFGMSLKNLEWCKKYEAKMWTYLVENKTLFKTDYLTINKFVNDGPYTKDFGKYSPSKAAIWLGVRIINDYMRHSPDINLQALMKENDYLKILRLSKYKP